MIDHIVRLMTNDHNRRPIRHMAIVRYVNQYLVEDLLANPVVKNPDQPRTVHLQRSINKELRVYVLNIHEQTNKPYRHSEAALLSPTARIRL